MTLGAVTAAATGGDVTVPARIAYRRRPRRVAQLSRQPQQGPPVRPDRPQPGLADADPAARQRDRGPPRGEADEARHPPRLQRPGARRASSSAAPSSRPRSARRPARPAASSAWVSFRETQRRRPPGAIFGYRRQARNDRRLHQPRAPRRDRLGAARQLLERALGAARPRRPDHLVDAKAPRRRPSCAPQGLVSARCVNDGPRGYLSIRTNADPKRQAHRPHRRRSRRRWASSSPAGACT